MKKWVLFFTITFFWSALFASPIQEHKIDPTALFELTHALGISEKSDIVYETQKKWLRKNQERWEMKELTPCQRHLVLTWAEKQGLFTSWKPFYKIYDKALILGATTSRMQLRLNYLKELWKEGVRFSQIVWLTGDRPLDPSADDFLDQAKNESEAAYILWEKTDLPEDMKNLPVIFIASPMKKEGSSWKRPNTQDTILKWLETAPKSCSALFVSDQPFCGYQFAVLKLCMPDSVQFDLVGKGVDPNSHPAAAAITLDSIARWIYAESLYQNKDS